MRIGGFQKLSLVDYPGKVSAIVFTKGCNFRCKFCYVPQLVLPERMESIGDFPEEEIFSYLEKNRGLVDAVVITGGEPTIQPDLVEFVERIKSMGFLVGLETNGTNSKVLERLIDEGLVDYVGMDIKTRLEFGKYREMVGGVLTEEMFENVQRSIELLMNSKIEYDFRTTIAKEIISKDDIVEICKRIRGARVYYLQNFRWYGEVVGGKRLTPYEKEEIEEIIEECKKFVNIRLRNP